MCSGPEIEKTKIEDNERAARGCHVPQRLGPAFLRDLRRIRRRYRLDRQNYLLRFGKLVEILDNPNAV